MKPHQSDSDELTCVNSATNSPVNIVCYLGKHLDLTCFITEVPNLFAVVYPMHV